MSILVTAFVQGDMLTLPLLKDVALHGENLENFYLSLVVSNFFKQMWSNVYQLWMDDALFIRMLDLQKRR